MAKKFILCLLVAITLVTGTSLLVPGLRSAITNISGLAVAQTATMWNNLRDAAAGDNLTGGVGAFSPYVFDGTNFDRARGDTANGLDVDVTRVQGTVTVAPLTSGTSFYAIKRTNIAAVSANLAFGFTSERIVIEAPGSNTDEICVDWLGGTAVCPAANTAGDDRIAAGRTVTFDNYAVTSISVIAASGTQTVYVRAFE